jgi:hypothetical protein
MKKAILLCLLIISLKGMGQAIHYTASDSLFILKPDTIRCIIWYCDTAMQTYGSRDSNLGMLHEHDPHTYWMFGYWVTVGSTSLFDERKKPLSKSIIVLDIRQIK